MRSVVVHGHFYQPPREEPWLEILEREPSAAPYHDWNQRIEHECYSAVCAARLPQDGNGEPRLVNLMSRLSFDFGPTLLTWLEREADPTYRTILQSDAQSASRLGHGNAIAAPYHHVILPLASPRDRRTEVRWGLRDFRRRFGRDPEGFWLPETAVDQATLDVLSAEGIRFTILAPHQVRPRPERGLPAWVDTAGGGRIAIFAYDGAIAHEVAFGALIRDGEAWARRMLTPPAVAGNAGPSLVSLATDGETYGHHHKFGEMALAAMLEQVEGAGAVVENYASFLARHPPRETVELVAASSWSCVHGIERWRDDCGCRLEPDTQQRWRAPLRHALEWLGHQAAERFERECGRLGVDGWALRDTYQGDGVLGNSAPSSSSLLELLEQQRQALRMFTSCGWFFDDIAGIEPRICLRHAARVIELAGAEGRAWRDGLLDRLRAALANDPVDGSGAEVFRTRVESRFAAEELAAAAAAVIQHVQGVAPENVGVFAVDGAEGGRVTVRDRRTGRVAGCSATVLWRAAGLVVRLELNGRIVEIPRSALPEPARFALAARHPEQADR